MGSLAGLTEAEVIKAICNASLFSGIGVIEQKMLAEKSVICHSGSDEIIIEEGEIGDKLYILLQGQMMVTVKDMKLGRRRINMLGPGDVFGEIAILRRIPRTARVSTVTPCTFLTINAHDFFDAYQYFPPRARDNIQIVIAKRLKQLEHLAH
ncbi:MAG: cyclic nucleotide-binding protein [Legionella sp. 40-6]|nr:cyclic nucleotide-binding domain-containing protein [Legionella sp.]OJY38411.1 MAG: cyclic nucleotide-binding protein [Legionella sp. 40-6]